MGSAARGPKLERMARTEQRLAENIDGEFYVDSTCIDCDACRQIAPATFRDHGGQSSVGRQPRTAHEVHRALMALVSSTASTGRSRACATPARARPPAIC